MGLLGLFSKVTHLGVDPTRARHETKHIVLANQFAVIFTLIHGTVALLPTMAAWPPIVRISHCAGAVGTPLVLLLNRRGLHTAASAWLLGLTTVVFVSVGRVEPEASELAISFITIALAAWFVFPAWRRAASIIATGVSFGAMALLMWMLRTHPPAPPSGFDVPFFGLTNRITFFWIIVAMGIYAALEMARVERALVAEREKTEAMLKEEVSHQVAERSRELGEALARIDGPIDAVALSPGDLFHTRYQVIATLGTGGMGAVYEVERLTDKQRLALKVVMGSVSRSGAARFAREAEIGARVHHPNLVAIVDVGVANRAPFLVMELVRGASLESRRERFGDVGWAMPILRQVACGLAALHDAGVVHRDLKPANVLLAGEGAHAPTAKISDFGISRFGRFETPSGIDVQAATVHASTPQARDLTGTGTLLGTPLYMAPEAARGNRSVETPADVFAFGILAYEVLTGRSPFAMPPIVLAMAGHSIPSPAPIEDELLSKTMREAILACLSIDPAERPTASLVRDQLSVRLM